MKIINFMKNYGSSTFRSLDDIAEKVDYLVRCGNGHGRRYYDNENDNNDGKEDYGVHNPYPEVKLPSREFVGILYIEHPYLEMREIGDIIRHRMEMRHYFPDKYKSEALARGDEYLADEMEEYRKDMLDAIEMERLRRQRARREKIGTITRAWFDFQMSPDGQFRYELEPPKSVVEQGIGEEEEEEEEPFTAADHRALCELERDF